MLFLQGIISWNETGPEIPSVPSVNKMKQLFIFSLVVRMLRLSGVLWVLFWGLHLVPDPYGKVLLGFTSSFCGGNNFICWFLPLYVGLFGSPEIRLTLIEKSSSVSSGDNLYYVFPSSLLGRSIWQWRQREDQGGGWPVDAQGDDAGSCWWWTHSTADNWWPWSFRLLLGFLLESNWCFGSWTVWWIMYLWIVFVVFVVVSWWLVGSVGGRFFVP